MSSADAEKKKNLYLFNCAQRAHGNYVENLPIVIPALLISGLKFPLIAAVLGLVWNAGRVVYALGYTSREKNDGSGRLSGAFFWFAQLALYILTGTVGYQLITGQA